MIRVLLAEDQAMVRGALAALLRLEPDIDVVADVERGDEIVPLATSTRPDVALLDIELPGRDGLAAAAQLREELPSCRVVMLTTFGRAGYLRRAVDAGAVGFLLKDAPAAELAKAIRAVMADRRVIDPGLALSALSEGDNPLTSREREVLQLVAEGKSTKEVAQLLGISFKTAESHRTRIMKKTHIHETAGLVRYAVRRGLIQP